MLEYYGDVIAMRHFQQGAPAEAARWASVPVINCGDGWGEHPTQVLTDLYTTQCELGTIDGLTFLLVGDMRMRTMHSILYALSQFDAKAYVVGPPEMSLLPEFKAELDELSVRYEEAPSVADVIDDCDVDLHGAGRPARLHEVARRARRERRPDAGGVPGHARAAARRGRSRARSSSTACPAWTSCPRTSTGRGTRATGRRPSTASSCGWR